MQTIYKKFFQKQAVMRKVLTSLIPITFVAVYFFGWRTLVLMGIVAFFGIFTEYLFEKRLNKKITEAALVTSVLFTLTLPISTPFWVAAIGIIFGIVFAKEVFGGFGYNVFNPALAARTFIYVTFPEPLTISWNSSATGFPGGFAKYITPTLDAVTQSTPLNSLMQSGHSIPFKQLFFGNLSGSLGETSGVLILIAGIILILYKALDWRLIAGPIIGFLTCSYGLIFFNADKAPNPIFALFAGGFLFLSVFMTTDPITAPKTREGKWIYGLLIGAIVPVIRTFGIFAEGAMFAVLIMNTFVPIIDQGVKYIKSPKKKEVSA